MTYEQILPKREADQKRLQANLFTLRTFAGWSTQDLANRLGVTRQSINNLENEKNNLSYTQYLAIRLIFDQEAEVSGNEDFKKLIYELLDKPFKNEEEQQKVMMGYKLLANEFALNSKSGIIKNTMLPAFLGSVVGAAILPLPAVGTVLGTAVPVVATAAAPVAVPVAAAAAAAVAATAIVNKKTETKKKKNENDKKTETKDDKKDHTIYEWYERGRITS